MFIQENVFENIVWKMAAILSRPQRVNPGFMSGANQIKHIAFLLPHR